jgi:DNA-binding transcriptional LysR family regulator
VRSGRAEVGLADHTAPADLTAVPVSAQDFLVVLPPGTPAPDPFPLHRLATLPLVAAPPGSSSRAILDGALGRRRATGRIMVETAQREAIVPLIAAGVGAGLLPRRLAETAALLGCAVAEPRPAVSRPLALVHRTTPLTPAARRFVEMAAAEPAAGAAVRLASPG